ncbi:MAG: thiamine biosynthesis protein ApbE [Halobacteriovorax sp.]|nr:thiamine biosynthesis protein ApbE [Halobacteriovorax sp.]|tara:strand:+ start:136922 stop:137872 length:951 start_codon:yes stop_codon:yes gene_type:complete
MDRNRISLSSKHMGGEFLFQIFPGSSNAHEEIKSIAHLAFDEVSRIENLLTDFRDSPFNQINKLAGVEAVEVTKEIFDIIEDSIALSKETHGAFDISFASMGHLWREHKKRNTSPSLTQINEAARFIDYKKIQLDRGNLKIFLPHKNMRIGLGGIGKGYAVDSAFELLRRYGLSNFYFNGSGDIRVHSRNDAPRPWQIGVRNPFSEDPTRSCAYFKVKNGAIATSGNYNNFIHKLGKKFHHIIDPTTGNSSSELVSVTVFSNSAKVCDTVATSVMIMGKEEGLKYLNHKNLNAFIIDDTGKVHHSKKSIEGMEQHL